METMLITGINGFLGSNLAKAFSNNYTIVGLEYGLGRLQRIKDCDYKLYDVQHGIPAEIFTDQKIDIIIHAATFYGRENEPVKALAKANIFMPFELVDLAIRNGCKLFINTDTVLDRFTNVYALTKRHLQEWLFMRKNEIKVINMKLEHIFGPGSGENNFITNMLFKLLDNVDQIDLTKGEQSRDFVFISDVVEAYKSVINFINMQDIRYEDIEVCTNNEIKIYDLLILMKQMTGSSTKLNFGAIPYRQNEMMYSTSNNEKLIQLGWLPKTELKNGLVKTISAIRKQ